MYKEGKISELMEPKDVLKMIINKVKRKRYCINPNPGFRKQLRKAAAKYNKMYN